MRRNLLLIFAALVGLLLAYNSAKRIVSYKGTAQKVTDAQNKLEALKQENDRLKQELEYKKSDKFAEEEIRNKLGLAKPGEEVYVVPKDVDSESLASLRSPRFRVGAGGRSGLIVNRDEEKPNWQKWKDYLWGGT